MTINYFVYAIIAANLLFSWQGFNNLGLFEKYKFRVGSILNGKEYIRLLSSGFLHVDWMHLLFNMIAFYSFGVFLGNFVGIWEVVLIYFVSLFAGNFLALYFNKNNYNYSAVGASGAVSGIVFASILFYPFGKVLLFYFLPIPSWIFGIAYLLYTVYGMNKKMDNIGHEAHLGGAVAGLLIAAAFRPDLAMEHWWLTIILLLIPMILFFVRPKSNNSGYQFTILNDNVKQTKRSVDDLYYNKEFEREKELNALLDKVNEYGIESLNAFEKRRLEELSK